MDISLKEIIKGLSLSQVAEKYPKFQKFIDYIVNSYGQTKYAYKDCIPVEPFQSTAWMIDILTEGQQVLQLWHKDAKIEDVVEAWKMQHPGQIFIVTTIDVGEFEIGQVINSFGNGRGVDQDMNMYVG